jgi:cell division protein FtsW
MAGGGLTTPMRAHRADYGLVLTTFVLLAIGMIIMYSISPIQSQKLLGSASRNFYFYNHLFNVALGVAVWVVISNVNYHKWRDWAPVIMAIAVGALIILLIPGLSFAKNGATRWIKLGPASFQPAELMKIALIFYLARWFDQKGEDVKSFWDGVVPFAIILGFLSVIIVIFQRDMGTMLVLAAIAVGMFYIAGIRLSHLAALVAAFMALGVATIVAFPHRMERLLTFLKPGQGSDGAGYHIQQALIGVGSGGILGLGLGKSIQIYGYLPEAPNDSIFAIIAEEFGLFGAMILIVLFGFLIYRAFKIAQQAPDTFGRLVATGIALWMMFQAIINIGAMLSLIPLTGIPLPFISYGGSSLVMTLFAMGILVNISKYTTKEVGDANSSERRRDSRSYFANTRNSRRLKASN